MSEAARGRKSQIAMASAKSNQTPMKTIEATVLVPENRQVTLRLPEDVPPGEHHFVLLIDEPLSAEGDGEATPTRCEKGLLVYDGELVSPAGAAIDEFREERLKKFFPKAP